MSVGSAILAMTKSLEFKGPPNFGLISDSTLAEVEAMVTVVSFCDIAIPSPAAKFLARILSPKSLATKI